MFPTIYAQNISEQNLRKLVSVLQLPDNQFQVNDVESLHNYAELKKQYEQFMDNEML